MGGGRHRFIADNPPGDPDGAPPSETQEPSVPPLERLCAAAQRRTHQPLALSGLEWSSYFRLHSRMVEKLRVRRAFLAGDAAHVHSPAGAQGMNTGIQEALNLGWKLARALSGPAPESLLDTYQTERHPIARDVLRQTNFITQLAEAERGPLKMLRPAVPNCPTVEEHPVSPGPVQFGGSENMAPLTQLLGSPVMTVFGL